ncbi:SRP72 [Candida pseudojiufengensis]|uniref:SRP72 n=1 Tax=Candida pseudojiufengensis TaxID=497109 RepID=UPI00222547E1|nr:SRP72 [Candida pseudojiufengensis]KAI5963099.1 SRP72 [Candida pseudojiufengensis]
MSGVITQAFDNLKIGKLSSESQYEKIYDVSFEYLSKVKNFNDVKSFKNCLVSLINLDKYEKANQIISKIPKDLVNELILEISYVYYKLGKTNEILNLYKDNFKSIPINLQSGFQHILAQTYYKIGDYTKASELYEEFISQENDNTDLLVNEKAILSQLIFQNGSPIEIDNSQLDESNYDLIFNQALINIAIDDHAEALTLLQLAHKVCSENNLSEEDVETELLPINLTLAYVYQSLGEITKSNEILSQINIDDVHDQLIKLIIKNNLNSGKIDNVNLLERKLQYQETIQASKQKLTVLQLDTILQNSLVLRFASGTLGNNIPLKTGLVPEAYKVLSKNQISFKSLNDKAQLKNIGRNLVRYINKEKNSNLHQAAVLLLVLVNSKLGSYDQSLPLLEQLSIESQNQPECSPGIVGTLINVYESTQNIEKLKHLLTKLIQKLLYTSTDTLKKNPDYFNSAKIIAMKNYGFNESTSHQLFEFLNQINPKDQLINSILSQSDENLIPIDQLQSNKPIEDILAVNIDELIPVKVKPLITSTKNNKKNSKVTKKKKAPKFGKNKVLKPEGEFKLDDERWLPKEKKKKLSGGHQGAVESTPAASASKLKKKKKSKK